MFKISEFSKLSQVPAKTLRFYDQLELLKPAYTDPQSGYRYYTSDQLLVLHRILVFKDLGFTLEQIRQLLHDDVSPDEMRGMFRLKKAEVQSLIQSEIERLRRIEARLEQIERGGTPRFEVLVKKVDPLRVVSVRETTSRVNIPYLFEEIDEYLKWNGVSLPTSHMVLWHSCAECEDNISLEIACPIQLPFPDSDRFKTKVLPEMTVASVKHVSRPDRDTPVSIDLGSWIERNHYRISSEMPSRECYLSRQEGSELCYITESQMPIAAC